MSRGQLCSSISHSFSQNKLYRGPTLETVCPLAQLLDLRLSAQEGRTGCSDSAQVDNMYSPEFVRSAKLDM